MESTIHVFVTVDVTNRKDQKILPVGIIKKK